jgi:SAM-dependent methyltransferase
MAAKWMAGEGANFGAGFEFWSNNLFELMDSLEDTVRTGRPALNLYEWIEDQPRASRAFQDWMVAIAGFAAGEVVKLAPLPAGARRLLDIGGGHGRYAMAYCAHYRDVAATVFDSPQALKAAEAGLAETGLAGRVTLQAGNFLAEPLGEGYDAALLLNIVHGFADEQNAALVRAAAQALRPGGRLVIAEQLAGRAPTPAANATKALLGLSYLHLLGGQLYAYNDLARWTAAAGLEGTRRIDSIRLPGTSLVLANRPAAG